VLIALDDLHWIDKPSAKVLRFASRRLVGEPVGLLASVRSPFRGGDPAMGRATDRLVVGPLDRTAIDAMLRARLPAPLRRTTRRRIFETSGGNPLFALELARVVKPGRLEGEVPDSVPTTLEAIVGHRVRGLPERTRRALLHVALLPDAAADLLTAALAASGLEPAVLDPAFREEVLRESETRIGFTHPVLRSVSYWTASTRQRTEAHRLVGNLLRDSAAGLRHRAMVSDGPDRALAGALEREARDVAIRGAPDAAAAMLGDALRLTPVEALDDRVRRGVARADRHLDAGETDAAIGVLRDLEAVLPRSPQRARVLHSRARAVGRSNGFRAGGALLAEALEQAGDDRELRCALERDLSNAMSNYGDLHGALAHGEVAAELAGQLDDPALVDGATVEVAVSRLFLGLGAPVDLEARAAEALVRLDRGAHVQVNAHLLEAMTWAAMLRWTDRLDVARGILERLLDVLDERDEDGLTLPVLFQLGELDCWSGSLASASERASRCAETAIAAGQRAWIAMGLYLRARVDAERGSVAAARAAAAEGLRMAEQQDDARMVIRNLHVLGSVELPGPDPAGALPHLQAATSLADDCGYREPGVFRVEADAIEALVAAGQLTEAEHRTAALEASGRRLRRPYALVTSSRCRAVLGLARGELDEALKDVTAALDAHDTLAQPIERGRTLLVHGVVLRRQHRKAAARATLDTAASLFVEHGAAGWAEAARRELARIGGRAPSPRDLTPSEEAIAALVARGKRNQEIAGELYLSEKTVESNLTRIYRKLGVRSRAELAAQRRDQT
jgi:DNA-binding CsgD family transcriptional regulator